MTMHKPVPRRTILRAAGAAIALPMFDAMRPSRTEAAPSTYRPAAGSVGVQPRMICCYVPHGVNVFDWFPKDTGRNWAVTPTLQALADFQSEFTLFSGLGHGEGTGGHEGADTWLTGKNLKSTPGKDYQNAISVDQVAAARHGRETRFPSIELSTAGGTGPSGHSHTLAFDRNGTPLPTENSPQRLFNRLFVPDDAASRKATLQRYAERRSILDLVQNEARSLHSRLGQADQQKLSQYFESVRETERRVERLESWIDRPRAEVVREGLQLTAQASNDHDRSMWLDVMLELSYLAFQTDTTRVITFQFSREATGLENHHDLSHHGGDAKKLAGLARIDRAHVKALARFLSFLKQTRDGEGSMLDHTMVLYGSGMSNGPGGGHARTNLPLLLAGGSRLGLRHGQHLRHEFDSVPLSNVLLTMLQKMGIEADSFSDSTGTLTGLG